VNWDRLEKEKGKKRRCEIREDSEVQFQFLYSINPPLFILSSIVLTYNWDQHAVQTGTQLMFDNILTETWPSRKAIIRSTAETFFSHRVQHIDMVRLRRTLEKKRAQHIVRSFSLRKGAQCPQFHSHGTDHTRSRFFTSSHGFAAT
jgi:hypothetical protein